MKSIQVKWLLIAIIGILSIVSVTLCYRLKKLNDTVHNLYLSNSSNDIKQINSLIFESHFKDDLVLSNFNTSTTIIITFFTIIIALGGYISFQKIEKDIEKLKKMESKIEDTANKVENSLLKIEGVQKNVNIFENRYFFSTSSALIMDTYAKRDSLTAYFIENRNKTTDTNIIHTSVRSIIHNTASLLQLHRDFNKDNKFSNRIEIKDLTLILENVLSDIISFIENNNLSEDNAFILFHLFKRIQENEDMYYKQVFEYGKIKELFNAMLELLKRINLSNINNLT